MKQPFELAVDKFMEWWPYKKETEAVIICGSYVTGNPSKHSDIDLVIVLSEKVNWRERGNKIINGILIEYFSNPVRKIRAYFEDEFKKRSQSTAHMIFTGKVLFDKTGVTKKLKSEAKEYLFRKYPKADKLSIESTKYHLWDMKDNLEEVYESGKGFEFGYYVCLKRIFEVYSEAIGYSNVPGHKLIKFLSDKKDRKKYIIAKFPDEKFKKLLLNALQEKNKEKMLRDYNILTDYTIKKLGRFKLDGFKLKSPA